MIKNIMKNIGLKPVEVEEEVDKARQLYWEKDAKEQDTDTLKAMITEFGTSDDYSPVALEEYKKELERRSKEKPAEVKEPFLIQGMTKDKYIPWRMDAHGETKAQAESAWNHAEEQAKNKGNDYDHSALRG